MLKIIPNLHIIKHPKILLPKCENCVFYKKPDMCTVFSSQDPVSGGIVFENASRARMVSHQCGSIGRYYSPK